MFAGLRPGQDALRVRGGRAGRGCRDRHGGPVRRKRALVGEQGRAATAGERNSRRCTGAVIFRDVVDPHHVPVIEGGRPSGLLCARRLPAVLLGGGGPDDLLHRHVPAEQLSWPCQDNDIPPLTMTAVSRSVPRAGVPAHRIHARARYPVGGTLTTYLNKRMIRERQAGGAMRTWSGTVGLDGLGAAGTRGRRGG